MNAVKTMINKFSFIQQTSIEHCQVLETILGPRNYTVEMLLGFHKELTICQTLVGNGYVY